MITQEDRERLALNDTITHYRRFKRQEYESGRLTKDNQRDFHIWLKNVNKDKDLYMADCLLESRRKRKDRAKKKISILVSNGTALFLTMTFRDSVFETTTKETRRRYVRRYLKKYSNKYVANIDYGEENGREHYHAVVDGIQDINFKEWFKSCGAIQMRHIKTEEQQAEVISRYITKLTNHAVKHSTNNERLIYSRQLSI